MLAAQRAGGTRCPGVLPGHAAGIPRLTRAAHHGCQRLRIQLPSQPISSQHAGLQGGACPWVRKRALEISVASTSQQNEMYPSELQSLLNSIPYKKIVLWGLVGAVGYQMHEFFGVSA